MTSPTDRVNPAAVPQISIPRTQRVSKDKHHEENPRRQFDLADANGEEEALETGLQSKEPEDPAPEERDAGDRKKADPDSKIGRIIDVKA